MSVQHSAIADGDRHELKGASSATINTVPKSNGDGTTTFGSVDYSEVSGTPAASLPLTGGALTGPLQLFSYTLATLPNTVTYKWYLIVVTDATAGPALCLSNGTIWVDVRTNVAVV